MISFVGRLMVVGTSALALWQAQRRLPRPGATTWSEAVDWLAVQPVGAAFALGAWLGLGLAAYLLVATLAGTASSLAARRRPALASVLAAVAGPVLRHGAVPLAGALLGVGAVPAHAGTAAAGEPAPDRPGTAVLTPLGPAPAAQPAHEPPAPHRPGPPEPATWTIAPGEHLWEVAATTVRSHRPGAGDVHVLAYLHELIAVNRHVLVVPGQPDLVFPGQVFTLPDPGPLVP